MNNEETIKSVFIETTIQLFDYYSVPLTYGDACNPGDNILDAGLAMAGIIGFTSDMMRGSIVLALGEKPLRDSASENIHHRDWIQELSNQLLGRIKNKLLNYGLDLQMTTPLSLRGMHLVPQSCEETNKPFIFRTNDGDAVCVLFDAEIDDSLELKKIDDEPLCPSEGELLLF